MSDKWKIFWVASLALVVFFQACGMHSWEELIVSTDDEKQMGREFDSLIKIRDKSVMQPNETLFTPENAAQQELWDYYVARAKEVVNKIRPEDLDALMPFGNICNKKKCTKDNFFEFNIINSKTVNAFAVPGGYVYFYTAILKSFQSESELMSVLSHEIGHVVLHHSRNAIVKQVGAATIIDLLLEDGIGSTLAQLGSSFWLLSGSRENESEADSMGFYYTNAIGISSTGLSDFFERGLIKKPDGTCDKAANSSIGDVFSTHPPSCERVIENNKKITASGQNFPKDKSQSPSGKYFKELVSAAGI